MTGTLWDNATEPTTGGLTTDEAAILAEAQRDGYYVRSGHRLAVLLAWRRWCQRTGKRCVVARRGEREAAIEVNGRIVAKVPVDEIEATAARAAGKA